jgi:uncharacterized protein (TIGR00251 family)
MRDLWGVERFLARGEGVQSMNMATLKVKVVPGSSRDGVAGMLGEALKVRVSAPPEGGKANRRLCELLADKLGLPANGVVVLAGGTSARKTLGITGLSQAELNQRVAAWAVLP